MLFFDLDRFKVINDSLGHEAGDQTLVAVAGRVQQCLRSEDTLARFGGDEFCVLLPEISHAEDAAVVARKILRATARPVPVRGRELDVTVSVGVAVWPQDGRDASSLLNQADAAMYAAKAKGRHRFEFANAQLGRNASTLLELEGDLRRALGRHELFVEFQPLVSLRIGEVLGFEALVRWRHPRRGLVPPAEFVPLAEDLGVIAAIDAWVVAEACRQVQWCDTRDARPYVAVNLSPAQLATTELCGDIDKALHEAGLAPSRLCLELSERAVAEDEDAFAAELAALKALGVSLALDDFGAGRTCLAQLGHLPLDAVKLDRGLVQRLTNAEGDMVIVSAIVGLAHALGLTVVAEGVERPEQLLPLRDLGCDVGQGYLFSRPQPLPRCLGQPSGG